MKNNLRKLAAKPQKRSTAILVAVVFLLVTVYAPTGVFAADETQNQIASAGVQDKVFLPEEGAKYKKNEVIVVYKDSAGEKKINNYTDNMEARDIETTISDDTSFSVATIPKKTDIEDAMEKYADSKIVEYVQPNYIYKISDDVVSETDNSEEPSISTEPAVNEDPSTGTEPAVNENPSASTEQAASDEAAAEGAASTDFYFDKQSWYFDAIDADGARALIDEKNAALSKVKIAVIDTGAYMDHEDMKGRFDEGDSVDLINGTLESPAKLYGDKHGHGTHVSGIIGATVNDKGVAGVATYVLGNENVEMIAIGVCNSAGYTTTDLIARGMEYAKSRNVNVINISLGGDGGDPTLDNECTACAETGITVVTAAGNENTDTACTPSDCEDAISVIALTKKDQRASYSNYGEPKDISAPGGENIESRYDMIISTYPPSVYWPNGSYMYMSGTSMAAPVVTACAAMMYSIDPDITVSEVKSGLYNSANDLYDAGWDEVSGYGKVMASGAVQSAIDGNYPEIPPRTIIPVAMDTLSGYLSGYTYTYDGHAKTPSITLFNKWGNRLLNGRDYSTIYSGGRTAVGMYSVTANQVRARYYGSQTKQFTIIPKGTSVKKLYRYKGAFRVKWRKQSTKMTSTRITGYQVQYSNYSNMTAAKIKTIKGYNNTRKTIRNLSKNKKYYVRIRTYMKTGGTAYYSNWSGIKSVKTR